MPLHFFPFLPTKKGCVSRGFLLYLHQSTRATWNKGQANSNLLSILPCMNLMKDVIPLMLLYLWSLIQFSKKEVPLVLLQTVSMWIYQQEVLHPKFPGNQSPSTEILYSYLGTTCQCQIDRLIKSFWCLILSWSQ